MRKALEAGRQKLSDYYSQTESVHGNLFAVGTILAPQNKLQFFSKPDGRIITTNGAKHTVIILKSPLSPTKSAKRRHSNRSSAYRQHRRMILSSFSMKIVLLNPPRSNRSRLGQPLMMSLSIILIVVCFVYLKYLLF